MTRGFVQAPTVKQLPTFSAFLRTQVAGKGLFKGQEVSEMMDSEYHCPGALVPFLQGSMDKNGFFTFTAKAVRLMATTGTGTKHFAVSVDSQGER